MVKNAFVASTLSAKAFALGKYSRKTGHKTGQALGRGPLKQGVFTILFQKRIPCSRVPFEPAGAALPVCFSVVSQAGHFPGRRYPVQLLYVLTKSFAPTTGDVPEPIKDREPLGSNAHPHMASCSRAGGPDPGLLRSACSEIRSHRPVSTMLPRLRHLQEGPIWPDRWNWRALDADYTILFCRTTQICFVSPSPM